MTKKKKASEALMDELHGRLAEELLERIEKGSATAADLAVARAFLKENGVSRLVEPSEKANDVLRNATDLPDLETQTEEEFENVIATWQ